MNSGDAERQIQQMIAFIKQEAKEKVDEIHVKTLSACTAEKLNITMQMSLAIREEFARKQKSTLITKRIERSKLTNESRMKSMKERDLCIRETKKTILAKMVKISSHAKYAEFIRLCIIESAMAMNEKKVYVQCRKVDEAVVKAQIAGAKKGYEMIMSKSVAKEGIKVTIDLELDTTDYLAGPPRAGDNGISCCGGVVLHANGKKMICRNTIDSRLDIAFDALTPQVRGMLFGVRE
jgi:V-type H+-transporting ATPase subunit E